MTGIVRLLVEDLDGELGAVGGGPLRQRFMGQRHSAIADRGRHAQLVYLEELWCEGIAAAVALALVGIDSNLHGNTTGT